MSSALAGGVLLLVTACSGGDSGGTGSAACASRVSFEGRTYAAQPAAGFSVAEQVGEARTVTCADTGADTGEGAGDGAEVAVAVYRVEGLDTSLAVAVGESADAELYAVQKNGTAPDEVLRFLEQPTS